VTLGALRDLAVDAVAEGTVKGSMFALIVPELGNLLRVAGDTGISHFTCKRNVQRSMRVFVTAQTSFKFEVGLSHMAVAALWNRFLDFRRMSDMTAYTPYILVLPSGLCNVSRGRVMTL